MCVLSLATLAAGAALAGPAVARTFVYVLNAQDANIDAYVLDKASGALTPVGKAEAGKLVDAAHDGQPKQASCSGTRSCGPTPSRVIS